MIIDSNTNITMELLKMFCDYVGSTIKLTTLNKSKINSFYKSLNDIKNLFLNEIEENENIKDDKMITNNINGIEIDLKILLEYKNQVEIFKEFFIMSEQYIIHDIQFYDYNKTSNHYDIIGHMKDFEHNKEKFDELQNEINDFIKTNKFIKTN